MRIMCESILKKYINEYTIVKATYNVFKTQYFDNEFTSKYTLLSRMFTISINSLSIDENLEAYIETHHQIKKNFKNLDSIVSD